jgi:hypothetical protein
MRLTAAVGQLPQAMEYATVEFVGWEGPMPRE